MLPTYTIYIGTYGFEEHKGATANHYSSWVNKNCTGYSASLSNRWIYTKKISLQNGIRFCYLPEKYVHSDSIKNSNNSFLNFEKKQMYSLDYSFYFNYHIKNITILSGMICPLGSYIEFHQVFNDKSTNNYGQSIEFGKFYLSENIQYKLFKNINLIFNLGIDIAPNIVLKYDNDYKIVVSSSIVWIMEWKRKKRERVDYIK